MKTKRPPRHGKASRVITTALLGLATAGLGGCSSQPGDSESTEGGAGTESAAGQAPAAAGAAGSPDMSAGAATAGSPASNAGGAGSDNPDDQAAGQAAGGNAGSGATAPDEPRAGAEGGGSANAGAGGNANAGAGAPPDDEQLAGAGGADSSTAGAGAPATDAGSTSASRLTAVPTGTSDAALGYWEYLPPNYAAEPLPLLVFTHGASWQGDGSAGSLEKLLEVGPPNLQSNDDWPDSRPFIVLSPQNPHSGCFTSEDIDGFYQYAVANYDVDLSRVYHTGQSCGAIGAWNYLAEHLDEYVTAAVLISGDGQPAFTAAGCTLGQVSIWGLHNENDGSVSSQGTRVPLEGLLACDPAPDAKLTIYPDETAHDAWTKTYDLSAGNDIYSWLLNHSHP